MIIVLCMVFLKFFGLSTLEKWKRQDVQIVRRKEGRNSLPPPGVTICPVVKDLFGWKPDAPKGDGLDKCRGQGDMENCVIKFTFGLEDFLNSSSTATLLSSKDTVYVETKINSSLWTSRMTDTTSGMCHTLIYEKQMSKATYLRVRPNYNFTVFLHDPKFFVSKDTSLFIPFLKLEDVFRKELLLTATITSSGR